MSVLNRILKTKQEEVTERKNRISERDLMSTLLAGRQRLSMRKALEESATGIIAEFKRKSPSGGFIHEAAGVQEVVGGYVRNGAAACSVLTDTVLHATNFNQHIRQNFLKPEPVVLPA